MIRVAVLDDHLLIVKGLADMISHIGCCELIASYSTIDEARKGLSLIRPDVILLDINLPDGDGVDYCREIKKVLPAVKILGLSTYDQPLLIKSMIRNGADGFLLKTISLEELKIAIEHVANGELYLQAELRDTLALDHVGKTASSGLAGNQLTRREMEILNHISEGYTSQQIADKLFIALKTVETHRGHIMEKMQVRNVAGLIKAAMDKGLIQ